MSDKPLRWGILGPGTIAREFLLGAQGSATGRVTADLSASLRLCVSPTEVPPG